MSSAGKAIRSDNTTGPNEGGLDYALEYSYYNFLDYAGFVGSFPSTDLNHVGDHLTLSFDFRFPSLPGDGDGDNNDFRFGFYNSNGTPMLRDSSEYIYDNNDFGYATMMRIAESSTLSYIAQETGGTSTILHGTDLYGNIIGAGSTLPASLDDIVSHAAYFELLRTTEGIRILVKIDGNTILSQVDTSGLYTTFDEVAMVMGDLDNCTFRIDNVRVEYTPIPPSALLLGTGLLGLAALGFRRRPKL
jgi:hypothetical protein